MRFASTIGIGTLAVVAALVSACGASSTNSGDEGAGADSGASGQSGSGGGSGSSQGGASGTGTGGAGIGGTGGCGPCFRIACPPPVWLTIVPDPGAGPIADLTVDIPGLTLSCNFSGSPTACQWTCQALQTVPGGHYAATVSAPGFETQTVEFDINNPTNCGCCGCFCGGNLQSTVVLRPTGEPTAGCCSALDRDPSNCGSCGNVCPSALCQDGKCAPAFGPCLADGLGSTSCDAYCESLDLSCTASCGTTGDQSMIEWVGGVANCGADPNVTPRFGTCSEPFVTTGVPGMNDYQCCCEEP